MGLDAAAKPSFDDVPQFPRAAFQCNVSWRHVEAFVARETESNLDLSPDFQRGHVWTDAQATAYLEYVLRGGPCAREIWFNCPRYSAGGTAGPYVIVDGLQRLTAVRRFMRGELPAFGRPLPAWRAPPARFTTDLVWCVGELGTRAEVLRWYLDFNAGGTPHAAVEIARVRALLDRAEGREPT